MQQYEFGLVPVKIVKEDKAEYIQALIDAREQESLEPFRAFMLEEHIRNISKEIEAFKRSQKDDPINTTFDPIKSFSDPIKRKLYQAILQDNSLNYAAYGAIIGVSEATVKRRLNEMKREGRILRVGSNKTGHWEIVKGKGDEE
ncbi:MAG: AsnC family protein [Prevotella sp.]|nr:AsnC family protein [Prevotella sp.]